MGAEGGNKDNIVFFPAVDTVETVLPSTQGEEEVRIIRPAGLVRTGFDLTHDVVVFPIAS